MYRGRSRVLKYPVSKGEVEHQLPSGKTNIPLTYPNENICESEQEKSDDGCWTIWVICPAVGRQRLLNI